jgi:hypothetical protein
VADQLEPLSALAKEAIDAEQRRSDVDADMRERVLARVAGTIAFGAAAGVGVAAATTKVAAAATAGAAAGRAAAAAAAAGTGTGTGAGTGIVAGVTAAKVAPIVIAAFVAGGGAGAVIQAQRTTPAPKPVVTAPVVTPPPPVESVVPVIPTPSVSSSAPVVSSVTAPPRPGAGNDTDLGAERALVDRARMALARGQPGAALEALDAHARAYPRGRLAEEREAMAVQALAQAGRTDEARARATRFRAAYPKSVFSSVVDAAVGPK